MPGFLIANNRKKAAGKAGKKKCTMKCWKFLQEDFSVKRDTSLDYSHLEWRG